MWPNGYLNSCCPNVSNICYNLNTSVANVSGKVAIRNTSLSNVSSTVDYVLLDNASFFFLINVLLDNASLRVLLLKSVLL